MKNILITGKASYVGRAVIAWLEKYPTSYTIDELDVKSDSWKEHDFSPYDVIFHVAGIAHVSTNPDLESLYYEVNRDLTIDVAKKAKDEGVDQFIFMSSMIVYGDKRSGLGNIDLETEPEPANFYGESKLQAEKGILPLQDNNFKVVILRPPMIYGKNSKGNYPKLSKLAQRTPIFPNINNKRSMLHIENLCEFIRLMIDYNESGTFYPQNKEYTNTSELVKLIGDAHGRKVRLTKLFNRLLEPLIKRITILNKVFGDLAYNQTISKYKVDYYVNTLPESIKKTERK